MNDYRFAPASPEEKIVFGVRRPRVASHHVEEWVKYVQAHGIQRVCCLMEDSEMKEYSPGLLEYYKQVFGEQNVCQVPIRDVHLIAKKDFLEQVLPFLRESDRTGMPTVVHCWGGIGRTGHVLAGWLVHGRGYRAQDALDAVLDSGRNLYEAVEYGNANMDDLMEFLKPTV